MNLDLFPIGWVHMLASLVAILVSAAILVRPKGTPAHRRRGRVFVGAILVTSLTALFIYRRGVFFFPHWLALVSLAVTATGFAAARFKVPRRFWPHLHLTCMLASVYILIGGGVNEVFLRIDVLHRSAPGLNSPAVGMVHLTVIVLFAVLIAYFNATNLVRRQRPTPG
jgi:uncharacterized membrane protein